MTTAIVLAVGACNGLVGIEPATLRSDAGTPPADASDTGTPIPDAGDTGTPTPDATPDGPAPSHDEWTWISGSNATGGAATYGTRGTAAPTNTPGARYGAASWSDAAGHFWLSGGTPASGNPALNDVWKFDGASWTWMAGSNANNAVGVYGTRGTAAPANIPGARYFAATSKDAAGNVWLFGGKGYGGTASFGWLSDLWKFDGAEWAWISGATTVDAAASYGTRGMAGASNTPGGRYRAVSWVDGSGSVWIFGGRDASSNDLNDLWNFDGTSWTWVSGANTLNAAGVYGTQGVAAAGNAPGAREDSVSWIDGAGHLWLYGGWGYDSVGQGSDLGDVWKFDGTKWTWVSGSNTGNVAPSYGTRGVTLATNDPGGRENAAAVRDANGTVWVASGTISHGSTELDDLWKLEGTSWTWVSGGNTTGALGTYGMKGMPGATNVPGARDSANAWMDTNGSVWLFGGWGYPAAGSDSDLNDLWRYRP